MTRAFAAQAKNIKSVMVHENRLILTLCIIHIHPRVLLGMKKRGFGEGKWNGFGGKVEQSETIESAVKREVREEAGIIVESTEPMGIIEFTYHGSATIHEVHIFSAQKFSGEPFETEEMRPKWFHVDKIP